MRHKDSFYFAVTQKQQVLRLGKLLSPYAVTKLLQWEVVMEWCERRIAKTPYDERDLALIDLAGQMNRRGK